LGRPPARGGSLATSTPPPTIVPSMSTNPGRPRSGIEACRSRHAPSHPAPRFHRPNNTRPQPREMVSTTANTRRQRETLGRGVDRVLDMVLLDARRNVDPEPGRERQDTLLPMLEKHRGPAAPGWPGARSPWLNPRSMTLPRRSLASALVLLPSLAL